MIFAQKPLPVLVGHNGEGDASGGMPKVSPARLQRLVQDLPYTRHEVELAIDNILADLDPAQEDTLDQLLKHAGEMTRAEERAFLALARERRLHRLQKHR